MHVTGRRHVHAHKGVHIREDPCPPPAAIRGVVQELTQDANSAPLPSAERAGAEPRWGLGPGAGRRPPCCQSGPDADAGLSPPTSTADCLPLHTWSYRPNTRLGVGGSTARGPSLIRGPSPEAVACPDPTDP